MLNAQPVCGQGGCNAPREINLLQMLLLWLSQRRKGAGATLLLTCMLLKNIVPLNSWICCVQLGWMGALIWNLVAVLCGEELGIPCTISAFAYPHQCLRVVCLALNIWEMNIAASKGEACCSPWNHIANKHFANLGRALKSAFLKALQDPFSL